MSQQAGVDVERGAPAFHIPWPFRRHAYLLVHLCRAGTISTRHEVSRWETARTGRVSSSTFPSLIQRFFTDRLLGQLGASPHTVAAYRDAFRMLLQFVTATLGRAPSKIRIEDLDVSFLGKFLQHLESERSNGTRTRNNRLSALRAFFRYVAITEPAFGLQCQRVLAMPSKRYERKPVEFLTEEESAALLAAPDIRTWIGRRDRALLLLALPNGSAKQWRSALHIEETPGRGVWDWRTCSLPGQGQKAAMHTVTTRCCRGPEGMAVAAGRRTR